MLISFSKRNAVYTCALISIAAMLGGCSTSVKTIPVTHTASDGRMQSQASTRVAEGETLTVKLPTQGGATYVWRLAPESAKSENVVLLSRVGQRSMDGGIAATGEPAMDVFTFEATEVGSTTLMFKRDQGLLPDQSKMVNMTLNVEVFDAEAEAEAFAAVSSGE